MYTHMTFAFGLLDTLLTRRGFFFPKKYDMIETTRPKGNAPSANKRFIRRFIMFHSFFTSPALLEAAEKAFVWQDHTAKLLTTVFLSMVPTFEGRYAVVTAIGMGLPVIFSYFLAFLCSSLPVPFILLLLRPVLDWFYTLPIKPVRKFAEWLEKRSERKRAKMHTKKSGFMGWLSEHLSAETMELVALYIFVALPLPGTGVWTGSAIATLFEMPRGKSAAVILLGNATACLITTLATTGIISLF